MTSLRRQVLVGAACWTIGLFTIFSLVLTHAIFTYPHVPGFFHRVFAYVWSMSALAALALGAGLYLVTRGLGSLDDLRARLVALRAGRHARLDGPLPAEVRPLVDELNALLDDRETRVARASARAGDLAHGLKTPLAVLAHLAESVAERGHGPLAEAMSQQVTRMRRQVDLHLAQARASVAGVRADARADVLTSADGLARALRTVYRDRELALDVTVPGELWASVAREDLDEMVGNLLDNACKWAHGRVSLAASREGRAIAIHIDDDGPGVAADLRERVLQRGVRADVAAQGTGLGLAIVRDLADIYGGDIALTTSPWHGLRVTLTLPATTAPPLSLGWIADDCLVCPYHAWRYDASGACVKIPQSAHATIPAKARTPVYRCLERYGLVWVCLSHDEPAYALPEIPELENGAFKVVNTGPFRWQADASRQVENFTDFGHFPWVHPGLLGDPERPVVPEHTVETRDHVLHYTIVRPEAPNSDDFKVFANEQTVQPERRSRYELHLPYTIVLRLGWGGDKGMVYFFASQPERADRCRGYCIIGRNYDLDDPDSTLQEFERVIFGQDQRIVESQRPEQVPFDLADELHLKFDAVAVAYRRAMRAQGLG